MKNSPRHLFYMIFGAVFLLVLGIYVLFVPVINEPSGLPFYLSQGTSKRHFLNDLEQKKLLPSRLFFAVYIYMQPFATLKTGEYLFPKGASLYSIWRQVKNGTGLLYHPFTIIPGWSFHQLRHELAETAGLRHQTLTLTDQALMAQLGYPQLFPEGEFFPDTYYYTKGNSDWVILKKAFVLMQRNLLAAWVSRANHLPYKRPYDALIAASLIEKEAHLPAERVIIAGVLANRLQKEMLLQFDPTVIYGMGDRYQGKIYKENLTENNDYNTYVHKGLPVTPIAMPSLAAIKAALHPAHHDYYYFVAKGDGSHLFSKH